MTHKSVLSVACLLALSACSGKEESTQTTQTDSVGVIVNNSSPAVNTASTSTPSKKDVVIGQTTWVYEKRMDAEAGTTHKASITSPTRLEFGFPYAGGSSATLTLRKRDDGSATVYLQVSRGQFNKSFQGGKVQFSFDGKAPETYVYSAAENGSATIVFFDAADALIQKLKIARNTTIDVTFFNQGNRHIEFRTADLRWPH